MMALFRFIGVAGLLLGVAAATPAIAQGREATMMRRRLKGSRNLRAGNTARPTAGRVPMAG